MDFNQIDWADSSLERIEIEFDCAKLFIFNDTFQRNLIVKLNDFIGITNFFIWDDMYIDSAGVRKVQDNDSTPFLQMLFSEYRCSHDEDVNCEVKSLAKEILEVQISLINETTCSLYCQSVEVEFE